MGVVQLCASFMSYTHTFHFLSELRLDHAAVAADMWKWSSLRFGYEFHLLKVKYLHKSISFIFMEFIHKSCCDFMNTNIIAFKQNHKWF